MSRLPTPGGDDNSWGAILNDYLEVAHNADGTLKSVSGATVSDGTVTKNKLSPAVQSSLTQADAVAAKQGMYQPGPDLHTDWTRYTPGDNPVAGDEGIPFDNPYPGASLSGLNPVVRNGRLEVNNFPDAHAALYMDQDIGTKVNRIGAVFGFGSGNVGGAVCLATWAGNLPQNLVNAPNAHCHFVIGPSNWVLGYALNGSIVDVASGTFATPLARGYVQHRAEICFDGATATFTLPDNSVHVVTDSHFASISGSVACWEFFRNNTGDCDTVFYQTWADRQPAPLGAVSDTGAAKYALQLAGSGPTLPLPVSVQYQPSSATSVTAPNNGFTPIDGTNLSVTIVAGASGKIHLRAQVYITMTAPARYLLGFSGAPGPVAGQTVIDGLQYTGNVLVEQVLSGLQAGASYTFVLQHFSLSANTVTAQFDNNNGYGAVMTATPVL